MRLYQNDKSTDRKRMTKMEIVSIFYKHLSFLFSTSLSLCGKFGSPLPGKTHSSRKSSATHSCQCVQYFPVSKRRPYGSQCWGFLTCAQMLMHAIAHGGCTDTVRESALKVDSGRKIPCRTGDSNPRQYCAWLFSQTLYQLRYSLPQTWLIS